MIVYNDRADMILSVRSQHRNKSVHVHEKRSFPKDCDEYTTKHLTRQVLLNWFSKTDGTLPGNERGKNGSAQKIFFRGGFLDACTTVIHDFRPLSHTDFYHIVHLDTKRLSLEPHRRVYLKRQALCYAGRRTSRILNTPPGRGEECIVRK